MWYTFRHLGHLPPVSCVYLWTARGARRSRRPFPVPCIAAEVIHLRFGEWHILDIEAWRRGERVVIWEGSAWTRKAHDPRDAARIREDGERMMAGIRLFISEMPDDKRLRQRVEGAIWRHLVVQTPRLCDEGMFICRRGPDEAEIVITNKVVGARIHGLQDTMVV